VCAWCFLYARLSAVQFLGNQGIAYQGSLTFTLSSFSGDFAPQNLHQDVSEYTHTYTHIHADGPVHGP
jgi:hypothetical protein